MPFDALSSCSELTNEHADVAVRSADAFRAFLAWAASVAKPGEGAPKVLMAIARLTGASCVDGAPTVEIRRQGGATTISVFAEHGAGLRERVAPLARLEVPIEEFTQAIRLAPQLIGSFRGTEESDDLLVLAPPGDAELRASQTIRIDNRSLHEQERETVPSLESPHAKPARPEPPPPEAPPTIPDPGGAHTHPTVRRMIAVQPEALRSAIELSIGDDD